MISKKTFSDMPKMLQQALILVLIYLFIHLIKLLLMAVFLNISNPDAISGFAFEVILIGFLVFKIGERKNWAKLILLVIFMLIALGLLFSLISETLLPETVLMSPITAILL